MWPKLNTMKHFLTFATLFSSLTMLAQLPYNPDANNDGLIGAFDLTSLLSVYSNPFSNGVLGEGVVILNSSLEIPTSDNLVEHVYSDIEGSEANSFVFDLTLFDSCKNHNISIVGDFVNGMTFSLIVPPAYNACDDIYYHVQISDDYGGGGVFDVPSQRFFLGSIIKLVWWNEHLHVIDAGI